MQTAKEFLVQHFGESALLIKNIEAWGNQTISSASFALTEAGLQTVCAGPCIMTLHRRHSIDKWPLYVCYVDDEGERWSRRKEALDVQYAANEAKGLGPNERLSKDEWKEWHSSRPHPVLKLCQSA